MYFNTKADVAQNLVDYFFYITLTVRGPFHGNDCKWKKIWGYGVNFWKKPEVLYAKRYERAEAPIGGYLATDVSLQYIYSVPVTKNHRNIQSRCLVHAFSFTDIFQRYWSWLQSNYIKEKVFVAASIIYGCGSLFLLWKGAQNDAHCNCIKPP